MQLKQSIMGVRGREKSPALAITVWHHSASLLMPDSDPPGGFFYLPLTPMTDPYFLDYNLKYFHIYTHKLFTFLLRKQYLYF